jgi:hypothetical protein
MTTHVLLLNKMMNLFESAFNDPLRSAESSRRLLLERESESDPEPFSSLRAFAKIAHKDKIYLYAIFPILN